MDAKKLYGQAQELFTKRGSLLSLFQELADNFYPERADFTYQRTPGADFANNLSTSYPILTRRELGDQISTMLRPTAKDWFHMGLVDSEREDNDAKRWLQWASKTMRRAMYDRKTLFTRATKEGDMDFATFGQCVISVQINRAGDAFLYRCWHLRDCVWMENADGAICAVFRKWKPGCRDLSRIFPGRIHSKVSEKVDKEPFSEVECMHMVVEMDMFSGDIDTYDHGPEGAKEVRRGATQKERDKYPYVSIYYDATNDHVMESRAVFSKEYVIPRWQTVSGSQYAYSPATVAALPEARLIQAMTYTLLEAGEKATNPPLIAVQDAVRSDISVYAGGVTWVDMDYDEKTGEALRPIAQDLRGLPQGNEMYKDSRQMIAAAFYLNKLTLPQRAPEMTAYEVGQRIQEYIRGALPLFEPMEYDYNGAICEETFDLGMRKGLFGSRDIMPESLQAMFYQSRTDLRPQPLANSAMRFTFQSPLHDAIEAQLGQKFLEGKVLLADAAAVDPSAVALIDVKVALREALNGIGIPAKWQRSEAEVKQHDEELKAQQQTQAMLGSLQQGAEVASTLSTAHKNLAETPAAA